jgi:hypothetical protein
MQTSTNSYSDDFDENIADSLIFTQLSYSPYNSIPKNPKDEILSNLPKIVGGEGADIDDINS